MKFGNNSGNIYHSLLSNSFFSFYYLLCGLASLHNRSSQFKEDQARWQRQDDGPGREDKAQSSCQGH